MKALKIPKTRRVQGLYTFCNKCKAYTTKGLCNLTQKSIDSCEYKERHVFKIMLVVPGTDGKVRKTKNLETRDLREAIRTVFEYREELEAINYQTPSSVQQTLPKPMRLVDTMSMYIDYLNNVGVPEHKQRVRTKRHVKDIERYFMYLLKILEHNGYNSKAIRVDQLNDTIVGNVHDYLLNELNYANKTYNKTISGIKQFLNWLISQRGDDFVNPFNQVYSRRVVKRQQTITAKEFEKLLSVITPENSVKGTNRSTRKYYYKQWLKDALKMALHTGLRREELVYLTWDMIRYDEDKNPIYLEVPNFKVNRLRQTKDGGNFELKMVPITESVQKLLDTLHNNRKADDYILAPEETIRRENLGDFLSKAFAHFWPLTGVNKKLVLNDLRNTYITQLYRKYGDSASVITNHSRVDVIRKHYLDNQVIVAAAKGFEVFEQR